MADQIYRNIAPTKITELSFSGPQTIKYDRLNYMTNEFGRFATLDRAPIVQKFFARAGALGLEHRAYTLPEMEAILGLDDESAKFSLRASAINVLSDDYAADSYIWNNAGFRVGGTENPNARFIVSAEGLSLKDFQVRAYDDNFDTASTGFINNPASAALGGIANTYIEAKLGDLGTFHEVGVQFVGDAPVVSLTEAEFSALRDESLSRDRGPVGGVVNRVAIQLGLNAIAVSKLDSVLDDIRSDLAVPAPSDSSLTFENFLIQAQDFMEIFKAGELPCFSVGTPIQLADGKACAIEDIAVGDIVAAFDERDSRGRGALRAGRVAAVLPGVTTEWIVLPDGTRVTPNHPHLMEDGSWLAAKDAISSDLRMEGAHQ